MSALRAEKGGVLALALGADELESYREIYDDTDFLVTAKDQAKLIQMDDQKKPFLATDKPYLIATFDDEDFFPSEKSWVAKGHKSLINFLRLVRSAVAQDADADKKPRWPLLGLDSYSGVGELANNAMCAAMQIEVPPKARGEGGAQYYLGYKSRLAEVARACRAVRGYGVHWIATCHVQMREADATATSQDVVAKEQQMPMFVGAFREQIPAYFDLVVFTGIGKDGAHYAQYKYDVFRNAKSRYQLDSKKITKEGRIENDWRKIEDAIL
jgi:hypothetical protein